MRATIPEGGCSAAAPLRLATGGGPPRRARRATAGSRSSAAFVPSAAASPPRRGPAFARAGDRRRRRVRFATERTLRSPQRAQTAQPRAGRRAQLPPAGGAFHLRPHRAEPGERVVALRDGGGLRSRTRTARSCCASPASRAEPRRAEQRRCRHPHRRRRDRGAVGKRRSPAAGSALSRDGEPSRVDGSLARRRRRAGRRPARPRARRPGAGLVSPS